MESGPLARECAGFYYKPDEVLPKAEQADI